MTTTKTICRKLLESTIADREAARNEIPFGLGEEGENTLMALKFALAAHEQEPVAYRDRKESNGIRFAQNFDYGKMPDGAALFAHPAPSIPTYRDGIQAAASWVDKQREAYDNEHGRHDQDTGAFEFGNDAQLEYSSTLADIADGIRALHPNAAGAPSIPAAVTDDRDYRAIVERIAEIMHGSVTDIDLLTVTVLSMKQNLPAVPKGAQ
ncbi:hypothetical protein TUM17576_43600 [Enterobacter hormaechei]|nr:hypothetical protein [Enterobacter hormaechei]GJL37540.1 hypothetical protein TUM17576_43600 [Enterobacter hormaechei]